MIGHTLRGYWIPYMFHLVQGHVYSFVSPLHAPFDHGALASGTSCCSKAVAMRGWIQGQVEAGQ